ncbi:hypothetical protein DNH61_04510 [Paenibacillus sambharensis]|uniref:SHOCT domain-containing protein n=1 Tax=Paenibacillus sambharensis TaxID=1803190 RepID=A0A2W1LQN3_9BACL|nr:SHOCT domain-containing protein [Paenibacillus sambharensis]PZD97155.1 hypothetical protein DNH61_04510 [Paenibacillus sambharensis]
MISVIISLVVLFIIVLWAFSVHPAFAVFVIVIGIAVYWLPKYDRKLKDKEKAKEQSVILNGFDKVKNRFTITKSCLSEDHLTGIAIDEERKQVCLVRDGDSNNVKIYSYRDLLESKIVEDGVMVTTTCRESQIGGALIGSLIAGETGAIIGGLSGTTTTSKKVTRIDLHITVNDMEEPTFYLKFSSSMEKAQHWHGIISVLIRRADDEDQLMEKQQADNKVSPGSSVADELSKLFELLRQGIISQEEFDKQKARLLG